MTADLIQRAGEQLVLAGIPAELLEKWQRLLRLLQSYPPAVLAYSGGVDSAFLAYVLYLTQTDQMLAITVQTGMETAEQETYAAQLASEFGFPHRFLPFNALKVPGIRLNSPERCYVCKLSILTLLWEYARDHGYATVLEGQNLDDESEYRPGRRAVRETGTHSPLADSGLRKAEIRKLARTLGLRIWDQPSSPCLATRFPYGAALNRGGMKRIATCEKFLAEMGFGAARVRYYDEMARIEVAPNQIERLVSERNQVLEFFKSLGFTHVTVDLEGYRRGSMDEGLQK